MGANAQGPERPAPEIGTYKGNVRGEEQTRDREIKHFENLEKLVSLHFISTERRLLHL